MADKNQIRYDAAAKRRELSRNVREIGPYDLTPKNKERREKASEDFKCFCKEYFPVSFPLEWGQDHIKAISKIERAARHGGQLAFAMPRGSGKTTLAECAGIWSTLYGYRNFPVLIGATEPAAQEMMDSIKSELEGNDLLFEDFPEVCFFVRELEGITIRCHGQLFNGELTRIQWKSSQIVFPTLPGEFPASGAIIKTASITGRIKGMKFKRPDGKPARPDFVLIDDPQTRESAESLTQCARRLKIIHADILGLAGPKKKVAAFVPCTVFRIGDVAEVLLDNEKHPEWNGERSKLLYKFPTNEKLWEQYKELRAESYRRFGNNKLCTDFYIANREAMDAGSVLGWPERFDPDQISALQFAMDWKFKDEEAFFSEYQNEPLIENFASMEIMAADDIARKLNGYDRGVIPAACTHIAAFIDVQKNLLFYTVLAFEEDFTAYVVDYGAYPDQGRRYFTLADATKTMGNLFKGAGLEGSIYSGLTHLTSRIIGREWNRRDGVKLRVGLCIIDANWGVSTNTVYKFCRESVHSAQLMPSHGVGIDSSKKPMNEYKKKPGERLGLNWQIPADAKRQGIRHLIYDTNYWKSFMHSRLAVAQGDKGCLSLFGRDPHVHRCIADHLTAEHRVETAGRGRIVEVWKLKVGNPDNHWLDCTVGSLVAASILGVILAGTDNEPVRKVIKRVKLSEIQAKKRAERRH